MVLADLLVCGFSALHAEKPHTLENECNALPKTKNADRITPVISQECSILCKSIDSMNHAFKYNGQTEAHRRGDRRWRMPSGCASKRRYRLTDCGRGWMRC